MWVNSCTFKVRYQTTFCQNCKTCKEFWMIFDTLHNWMANHLIDPLMARHMFDTEMVYHLCVWSMHYCHNSKNLQGIWMIFHMFDNWITFHFFSESVHQNLFSVHLRWVEKKLMSICRWIFKVRWLFSSLHLQVNLSFFWAHLRCT